MTEWTLERIAAVRQCLVRLEQLGLSHPLYDALDEIERLQAEIAGTARARASWQQLSGEAATEIEHLRARVKELEDERAAIEGAVGIPDFQSAWQRREKLLRECLGWITNDCSAAATDCFRRVCAEVGQDPDAWTIYDDDEEGR